MNNPFTSIAIADDSEMFRYVMKKIISDTSDFKITIEAGDGKELIEKFEKSFLMPKICILDIGMPVMDGYATIKVLTKRWPYVKVLVLSHYYHEYAIGSMIQMGAKGFISKEENPECIVEALISLKEDQYYYSKYVNKEMFAQANKGKMNLPTFTSVEKRLLGMFCTDLQYSEIAEMLFISKHTIEKHKQNISRKTGIHSREGLMLFAIQNDLSGIHSNPLS